MYHVVWESTYMNMSNRNRKATKEDAVSTYAAADDGGEWLEHGAGGVFPEAEHAVVVDLVPHALEGLHGLVHLVHHVRGVHLRLGWHHLRKALKTSVEG